MEWACMNFTKSSQANAGTAKGRVLGEGGGLSRSAPTITVSGGTEVHASTVPSVVMYCRAVPVL